MAHPSVAALEAHLTRHRPGWKGGVLMSVVQPVLLVLAFGVGVGRYVGPVAGMPYLDYVVPGMIAAAALQMAILDATYPARGCMYWLKLYHVQAATPLRVADVLAGHAGFSALKVAAGSTVFLGVAGLAGVLHSPWSPLVVPVAVLVALAGGLVSFAITASVANATYLELIIRCAVLPMTLFAGVFYPVSGLPAAVRALAYASPLWHGVVVCQAAASGTPALWPLLGHVGYLALWAAVGWWLALRAYRTQLLR